MLRQSICFLQANSDFPFGEWCHSQWVDGRIPCVHQACGRQSKGNHSFSAPRQRFPAEKCIEVHGGQVWVLSSANKKFSLSQLWTWSKWYIHSLKAWGSFAPTVGFGWAISDMICFLYGWLLFLSPPKYPWFLPFAPLSTDSVNLVIYF